MYGLYAIHAMEKVSSSIGCLPAAAEEEDVHTPSIGNLLYKQFS